MYHEKDVFKIPKKYLKMSPEKLEKLKQRVLRRMLWKKRIRGFFGLN